MTFLSTICFMCNLTLCAIQVRPFSFHIIDPTYALLKHHLLFKAGFHFKGSTTLTFLQAYAIV